MISGPDDHANLRRVQFVLFTNTATSRTSSISTPTALPPDEFARTYAWYQNLLNLRAAALHHEHGLDFLQEVRDQLAWEESEKWTTESLLLSLEEIAPDFRAWADSLPKGNYLPSDDD